MEYCEYEGSKSLVCCPPAHHVAVLPHRVDTMACVSGYSCVASGSGGLSFSLGDSPLIKLHLDYSQCLPVAAQSSATSATATTQASNSASATSTGTAATASGSQIRSVQDPVFHFYLQSQSESSFPSYFLSNLLSWKCIGGSPVLGPEASSGYFTISGSISLNNDDGSQLYLNVNETATTSYKSLSLDSTATTTDWGLEGDTIITTAPRQLNFLACATSDATIYSVYLQEGNDTPAGSTCTLVTLHLPCLC